MPIVTLITVAGSALLGTVAGASVPGVAVRVPAGGPVLRRGGPRPGVPRGGPAPAACAALGAVVCAALAARTGPSADLAGYLYLAWVGLALAVIDVACHRLPDALTLPSYPIALVLLGAAAAVGPGRGPLLRALAGMAALAAFYYLLAAAYPAGMGLGDVKLAGLLGLYLGWAGWPALVLGTFAAFLLSSVVALGLIAAGRATWRSALPFGPFMLVGALLGLFGGAGAAGWAVGG